MKRAHNFSAGPAVLPLSVIEELRDALPDFQNTGWDSWKCLTVLQHLMRCIAAQSRDFDILSIPDEYRVLFLQGGASLQFHMTAMNLLCREHARLCGHRNMGPRRAWMKRQRVRRWAAFGMVKITSSIACPKRVCRSRKPPTFTTPPTTPSMEPNSNNHRYRATHRWLLT